MTKKLTFLLIAFLLSPIIQADDQYPDWSVSGFGSFGYVGTDTNSLGFIRNRTQTKSATKSGEGGGGVTTDSRLGIQLDVGFSDSLHTTVQWVARDQAGDFFEQNLELAFISWRPVYDFDIRAGRLALDTFLISDHRNVGFTYPWMRPPNDFYNKIPVYHFDGADIAKQFSLDSGYLTVKVFGGYAMSSLAGDVGVFDMDMPITGISLVYETNNWLMKAVYNYQHLDTEIPNEPLLDLINNPQLNAVMPGLSTLAPHVSLKDTDLHYMSLGTRYDDAVWLMHAEISYLESETSVLGDVLSGYMSVGRRFSNLTFYSVYGVAHGFHRHIDIPTPVVSGPSLLGIQSVLDSSINNNKAKQQSFSLGGRWDVHPKIALKTQWVHYWFEESGAAYWRHLNNATEPSQVNVWSFGVDFVF